MAAAPHTVHLAGTTAYVANANSFSIVDVGDPTLHLLPAENAGRSQNFHDRFVVLERQGLTVGVEPHVAVEVGR